MVKKMKVTETIHNQFSIKIYSQMSTKILQSCGWQKKKLHIQTKIGVALRLASWALSEFGYFDSISEALVDFDDDSLKDFDPARRL